MKKSQLQMKTKKVARLRVWEKFNTFPAGNDQRRSCIFRRFDNPEAARLFIAASCWTKVVAWHQDKNELVALYSNGNSYILFDRYYTEDPGEMDVVVGVAAQSPGQLEVVMALLNESQNQNTKQPNLLGEHNV
jgi:hypothetical protein